MFRHRAACALALLSLCSLYPHDALAQAPQSLTVPPDSPRWELEGKASVREFLGRKCLMLDGGAAVLKDLEMRDGVLDVDVATSAVRGFFGFDFRIDSEGKNWEEVYL